MKKLFFTALVAIVAVGGAVAGNAHRVVTLPAGTLNGIPCTTTVDDCTTDPSSNIECTNAEQEELFTTDQSTGNCDIQLFKEITK